MTKMLIGRFIENYDLSNLNCKFSKEFQEKGFITLKNVIGMDIWYALEVY